jgi:hypothetical protein
MNDDWNLVGRQDTDLRQAARLIRSDAQDQSGVRRWRTTNGVADGVTHGRAVTRRRGALAAISGIAR